MSAQPPHPGLRLVEEEQHGSDLQPGQQEHAYPEGGERVPAPSVADAPTSFGWRNFWNDDEWPQPKPSHFLIDGLLHDSLTILAGEPGTGKSYLTVGYCKALLNGEADFLGQNITRRLDRIAALHTDPGAAEAFRSRLLPLVDREVEPLIISESCAGWDHGLWTVAVDALSAAQCELVIVDHALGVVDDPSDPGEARRFLRTLRELYDKGAAVLLVTHTAKPGPRGPAHGVDAAIGSRHWGATPRVKSTLTVNRGKGDLRKLDVVNNDGEDVKVSFRMAVDAAGTATWEVAVDKKATKVERGEKTRDIRADWAQAVLRDQPAGVTSVRSAAGWVKDTLGSEQSAETIRKALAERIERVEGGWQRKPDDSGE